MICGQLLDPCLLIFLSISVPCFTFSWSNSFLVHRICIFFAPLYIVVLLNLFRRRVKTFSSLRMIRSPVSCSLLFDYRQIPSVHMTPQILFILLRRFEVSIYSSDCSNCIKLTQIKGILIILFSIFICIMRNLHV